MHAKLHDLRLLYLAHQVENTFEGLEKAFHGRLPEELRQVLAPLFQGGPNHGRLEARFNELNAQMQAHASEVSVQDLLQALRDCERMAQDFYRRHVDEVLDAGIKEIFRGMAAEEGSHLAAVEKAITLAAGMDYSRKP